MVKHEQPDRRYSFFFLFVILTVALMIGRLWYLQLVRGEYYGHMADGNRVRQIRIHPSRGIIYDRTGLPLVMTRTAFSVAIVPQGIPPDNGEVLPFLGELLDMTVADLQQAILLGRAFPYEPVQVVRDVGPEVVVAIEENQFRLPGVYIDQEPVREYPLGPSIAHPIGYLGAISERQLRESSGDYRSTDWVGKAGLEQYYEQQLRGESGSVVVEVNALSRPIQTLNQIDEIPGHDLLTTLNHELQMAAYHAFLEHTETVRERFSEAYSGTVIALRPTTGEILAMVSVPSFEPHRLLDRSDRSRYFAVLQDKDSPFVNRAVQGTYGPGSSLKPFIAVAGLEEGAFAPEESFYATGTSDHGVRDWVISQGLAAFGWIDLREALAMSSNHYFAEMGSRVGIDQLAPWLRSFGFGEPTGVDLLSREPTGLVPDRGWKRLAKPNDPVWTATDTEHTSIGQRHVLASPLQLAQAFGVIATRGELYRPYLVTEVRAADGEIVYAREPELVRRLDVTSETWDAVISGMEAAITHVRGTARNAFSGVSYSVAGKTGSYEVPYVDNHGLFAAFAPLDEPEIVVLAIVEHGGGGGTGAAPIVRRVLDAYFELDAH